MTSTFIVAAQYLCYYIITGPILSESMNDIINYLLVFPMVACLVMAWYMWDWQFYTGLPYSWSPIAFISFGAALGFALPLGVVSFLFQISFLSFIGLLTSYVYVFIKCYILSFIF